MRCFGIDLAWGEEARNGLAALMPMVDSFTQPRSALTTRSPRSSSLTATARITLMAGIKTDPDSRR